MLAAMITTLVRWFAPWQSLYADSKILETTVTSIHIAATMVGGGIAIAADRDTLRAMRTGSWMEPQALDELHATHRPVVIGLVILFVSGVALLASDIKTYAQSPVLLIKLGFVALLCLNGIFLAHTEHLLRRRVFGEVDRPASPDATPVLWRRLRAASWLSITLWTCTVVAGTALLNV
ncbi:MAG TPA: hypothetical protein VGL65_13290 [Gemmatimonadales bacterium]